MKNKFKLVETEDYLLAVSDEEIEKDDYFYYIWFNADIIQKADSGSNLNNLNAKNPKDNFKKIIAYKPKGNAPELDLPLLPYVEDEVEKLAESYYTQIRLAERTAFKFGYKAATKKYSEEDLRKAMHFGKFGEYEGIQKTQEFIQSLKQPKWFVAEMKHTKSEVFRENDNVPYAVLKTTTIKNKIYLEGTYLN
jgi:hypothetical protein